MFNSPEFYPIGIDFPKRIVAFVRMSRETYHRSAFLDDRTVRLGVDVYGIRLDDLLLRVGSATAASRKVHYILHPTFSCSTLLARYFELIPDCLVLKEPMLLTQMALTGSDSLHDWDSVLRLCVRMLTRTYNSGDLVVIKPHEPCNALADTLLNCNHDATVTFLASSLREFVLSLLKTPSRRSWMRTRILAAAVSAPCPHLTHVSPETLTDAEAAAYLWLVNRYIWDQCSRQHPGRVHCLDARQLVESPELALRSVLHTCAFPLMDSQMKGLLEHPSINVYSKDPSRPYNSSSRREELTELEQYFAADADAALAWAASSGMQSYLHLTS